MCHMPSALSTTSMPSLSSHAWQWMLCPRCIERYPSNGRLLRAYGRLLEVVSHDPLAANHCYQEALKLGLHDSMMSLAGGNGMDSTDAAGRLSGMAGGIDEKVDGLVVTSADGTILMVNQVGGVGCFMLWVGGLQGGLQ